MTTPSLPDPVPLGVAGAVSIPREQFEALADRQPAVLLDDGQRLAYIAGRLWEAFDRPIVNQEWSGLARQMLVSFRDIDVMEFLAPNVLKALRDGASHDGAVFSPTEPTLAVVLVAWGGSQRDLHAARYGKYVPVLFDIAQRLVDSGAILHGVLQIDCFVRDVATADAPQRPLAENFAADVALSYLPGWTVGSTAARVPIYSDQALIDESLCDDADRQRLADLGLQPGDDDVDPE